MASFIKFLADTAALPAVLVGLAALVASLFLRKSLLFSLSGGIKASIGYMILVAGTPVFTTSLQALSAMAQHGFGIHAVVVVNETVVVLALSRVGPAGILIWILGYAFNLLVARFTPWKYIFLSGHHSLFMAVLLAAALAPFGLAAVWLYLLGGLILGLLQAGMPALMQPLVARVTGTQEFSLGHFSALSYLAAAGAARWVAKPQDPVDQIHLPGETEIFKEPLVSTALLLLLTFIVMGAAAGPGWVEQQLSGGMHWLAYCILLSLAFSSALGVALYGMRILLADIIPAYQSLAERFIPQVRPALDVPILYPFVPNAVVPGFLASLAAGILVMFILAALKLPVILPSLVPHFFVGAAAAVIGSAYGGRRGALAGAFTSGFITSLLAVPLLGALGPLNQLPVTFSDGDFQWVGILIHFIAGWFGAG